MAICNLQNIYFLEQILAVKSEQEQNLVAVSHQQVVRAMLEKVNLCTFHQNRLCKYPEIFGFFLKKRSSGWLRLFIDATLFSGHVAFPVLVGGNKKIIWWLISIYLTAIYIYIYIYINVNPVCVCVAAMTKNKTHKFCMTNFRIFSILHHSCKW